MIFLIGTKNRNVKNGIISDAKCPKCEKYNSLYFSIYKSYTYLTFIPLFPVGKYVNIECSNCKSFFDYEDLSEDAQTKLRNEKIGIYIWMFTGSIILVVFLIFTIANYFQTNNQTSILVTNPIAGDVYNLKFSNGYYSTMRIDKVTTDSIYTTHNDFDAYMPYEVDELNKSENYTDRKVNYSRKQLNKLYENDEIIKISRKN